MRDPIFDDTPVRPEPQPAPRHTYEAPADTVERNGRRLVRQVEAWLQAQPPTV